MYLVWFTPVLCGYIGVGQGINFGMSLVLKITPPWYEVLPILRLITYPLVFTYAMPQFIADPTRLLLHYSAIDN
jgi:hypothetical protein